MLRFARWSVSSLHSAVERLTWRPWFIILLALVGAVILYMSRAPTQPTVDRDGCRNTQDPCVEQAACDDGETECEARIGHSLFLNVQNFQKLPGDNKGVSKLVLFLNGVALPGVNALPTGEPGRFRFYLRYQPGSETAWRTLLREPTFQDAHKPAVPVSLGVATSIPVDTAVRVRLGYFDRLWLWMWWASSLATLSLIWHFRSALKVPIASAPQAGGQATPVSPVKYSLARVQLAFWSFLILSGYLFVAWMMWDYNLLNPGLIALLGVSSATAIGSAVVDKTMPAQSKSDAAELVPRPTQTRDRQRKSGVSSFIHDILSDENCNSAGVEFYRLQNVFWTLFLGITFGRAIWNTAALPDLDANLVLLMGVSSGTYVGLKATKKDLSGNK